MVYIIMTYLYIANDYVLVSCVTCSKRKVIQTTQEPTVSRLTILLDSTLNPQTTLSIGHRTPV